MKEIEEKHKFFHQFLKILKAVIFKINFSPHKVNPPLQQKKMINNETKNIMEPKIETFTLENIISRDFFFYFKNYIKQLVEDQRIAKRDRKDVNHPCPENRKYSYWNASEIVRKNRFRLCMLYKFYYFIKHNKNFDWHNWEIKITDYYRWKTINLTIQNANEEYNGRWDGNALYEVITKYMNDVRNE